MTRQDLLDRAEWLETLEVDAEGSWAKYLHAKAQGLRTMAVNAPDEEDD